SRRPGLPAPVDPQPLIRVFTDDPLQMSMQDLSVKLNVAGDQQRGIEAQYVLALLLGPERESGNNRGARARCDPGEPCDGAGRDSKEIDENSIIKTCVLVDQNSDGFIVLKRA